MPRQFQAFRDSRSDRDGRQLKQNGHAVVGACILFAPGRALPDLVAILRSHALIHTAEGEFFREVLVLASEHCSLPVTKIKERAWRQDEKLATMAALLALA